MEKKTWGLKDQGTEKKGQLVILNEGILGSWLDNDDVGKNCNVKVYLTSLESGKMNVKLHCTMYIVCFFEQVP